MYVWTFCSVHSLTSRVCPVKSLPQNSHLARRWGHVYLRWSSIRTRGICAPHLLVQGTASCLHVLRWACQEKPIFSVTTFRQCHDSLARGGIIQWLLSSYPCSLTSSPKKQKNHLTVSSILQPTCCHTLYMLTFGCQLLDSAHWALLTLYVNFWRVSHL